MAFFSTSFLFNKLKASHFLLYSRSLARNSLKLVLAMSGSF